MRDPFFLTAASVLALTATPAVAQESQQPQSNDADTLAADDAYADDDGAIVVTAPRGSIAGDIAPEDVLDARDIQATGATSIDELLEALAPQLGSTRGGGRGEGGGRPIILIEGQRISSFREMRDLPPEAIERVDILPEEAALQFGYSPDQKVVNFVLRERFNSTAVEFEGKGATRGGRLGSEVELDKFLIIDGKRTSVGLEFENWGALDETERDVLFQPIDTYPDPVDPRPYRTLLPATESYQLNASHKRSLGEKGLTVTLGLEQQDSRSRFGAPVATFDVPDGSIYANPAVGDSILRLVPGDALGRTSRNRTGELAAALTGGGEWSWSVTTQATLSDSRSRIDRGPDTDAFQAGLDALDPAFDPYGALPDFAFYPRDEARSDSLRLEADGLINGIVGDTAAGPITVSFRALATHSSLHSEGTANGVAFAETDLKRTRGLGRANLDVPLLDRDSGVGSLSINANATVETLSDFGELYSFGGGINWRPTRKLSILGNFGREESAPSLSQLGAPRVVDPLTSFFDFTTGETVFVTATTGGNPNLLAERRDVTKLSAQWQLPTSDDIDLRAEYVRERITNPAASFPAATPIIEAAFPGRFTRDDDGTLVAVDLTPVNYDSQARDQFKWGVSWSKEIEAKPPSEETREKMRARFAEMRARRQQQSSDTAPQGEGPPAPEGQEGAPPPSEGEQQAQSTENRSENQAQRGGGRGGGGGMFGRGGRGGRLGINAFHTVTFKDEVTIAEGVPLLDYLDGEAASRFGGTPRHTVELQGFRYNNGLGIRLSADWRSATSIDGAAGPIRFSDYADVDLRLWYNLAEKPEILADHPWMRGMRVRLAVDNLFDSRPKVTGPGGEIPFTYQPAYLEPQGRTISISLRKLFVPRKFIREEIQRVRGD